MQHRVAAASPAPGRRLDRVPLPVISCARHRMPDFWPSCGYRLLKVGADRRLTLTDDFLRSSLLRPELAPLAESCAAEMALHEELLAVPRRAVAGREIAAIADEDAR